MGQTLTLRECEEAVFASQRRIIKSEFRGDAQAFGEAMRRQQLRLLMGVADRYPKAVAHIVAVMAGAR